MKVLSLAKWICVAIVISQSLCGSALADATKEFLAAHGDFAARAKRFGPLIEARLMYAPEIELDEDPGEFDLLQHNVEATLPIPLSRDEFAIVGGSWGARSYKFDAATGLDDETLYNASLRLGYGVYLNDDFVVQGYWEPSILSDFDGGPDGDDWFLWYGTGLAVYRVSDTFFWKGGLRLSDALNTTVLPIAGFSWLFAPEWRLDILAPRDFEVSYSPNEEWIFHGGLQVEAEKYHFRQDFADGAKTRNAKIKDYRLFIGTIYRFAENWSCSLNTGVRQPNSQ